MENTEQRTETLLSDKQLKDYHQFFTQVLDEEIPESYSQPKNVIEVRKTKGFR